MTLCAYPTTLPYISERFWEIPKELQKYHEQQKYLEAGNG
jgi:hypothetical protein